MDSRFTQKFGRKDVAEFTPEITTERAWPSELPGLPTRPTCRYCCVCSLALHGDLVIRTTAGWSIGFGLGIVLLMYMWSVPYARLSV